MIGQHASDPTPENTPHDLFGVTIYDDFRGRDLQPDELPIGMGCTRSKNFAEGIGPGITIKDEFDDLYAVPTEARLNGDVKVTGKRACVLRTFDKVPARASLGKNFEPEEATGSGTIRHGCAVEHDTVPTCLSA